MALLGFPEHLLCWAQAWSDAQSSLKAQMEPFPSEAFVLGVGGSWLTSLHRVYGWGGGSSWAPLTDVKLAPVEWLQEGRGISSSQPFWSESVYWSSIFLLVKLTLQGFPDFHLGSGSSVRPSLLTSSLTTWSWPSSSSTASPLPWRGLRLKPGAL